MRPAPLCTLGVGLLFAVTVLVIKTTTDPDSAAVVCGASIVCEVSGFDCGTTTTLVVSKTPRELEVDEELDEDEELKLKIGDVYAVVLLTGALSAEVLFDKPPSAALTDVFEARSLVALADGPTSDVSGLGVN